MAAQSKRDLFFIDSTQEHRVLPEFISEKKQVDSIEAIQSSREVIMGLQKQGYLTAGIDSILFLENKIVCYLYVGKKYMWAHLRTQNIDQDLKKKIGPKSFHYDQKLFNLKDINTLLGKLVQISGNLGYPFATAYLDSISIIQNQISANINFEYGPLISFDTLVITGNSKIKKTFLSNYLQIVPGQAFEEKKYESITKKIRKLPYLRLVEAPDLTFQNSEGTVYLNIEDKKVNHVDGILGVFPNSGNKGKVLVTGQFNLLLQNLFNRGKYLNLEWQKVKPLSQILNVHYIHPYIINSPISVGGRLKILKEDTTFINRELGLDFEINNGPYSDFKLFTQINTTALLSTEDYRDAKVLPQYSDVSFQIYGLGYRWSNLDDLVYPTKGLAFNIESSVGNKKIKKNIGLPQELYEGVPDKSLQVIFRGEIDYFFQISRKVVLYNHLSGGIIDNQQLFLNDLFRLGGLHTIRGFNENYFFASEYLSGTIEARLLLDQQSHLLAFFDQGIVKNNLNLQKLDHPSGFGLGLSLGLDQGHFNFIYALGNSQFQPLSFQTSKIHFGYISRF